MSTNKSLAELKLMVGAIRSHYVHYEKLEEIKQDWLDLMVRENARSEGGVMTMFGASGSGKSKLIAYFEAEFPVEKGAIQHENGEFADRKPVVIVQVPDTGLKSLIERLYTAATGAEPPTDRRSRIQEAIVHHLREMETKLIIFDETHQATEDKTDVTARAVARLMKDLSNEGLFSILIVGTEDAKLVIKSNKELNRRLCGSANLGPLDWDNAESKETFLDILDEWDDKLESVFGRRCELSADSLAAKIHKASGGLIGLAAMLIETAGKLAATDMVAGSADRITENHLHRAVEKLAIEKGDPNPFEEPGSRVISVTRTLATENKRVGTGTHGRKANKDRNFRP